MGGLFTKSEHSPVIDIDFQAVVVPSEGSALEIYQKCVGLAKERVALVLQMSQYKGCQELARKAIQSATTESQREAFDALLINVDSIARYFQFSKQIESIIPELLSRLSEDVGLGAGGAAASDDADLSKALATTHLSLARQLAELVNFALEFDEQRLKCLQLSNDFSFYRRLLGKFEKGPDKHEGIRVSQHEALLMAQFTADCSPMISSLMRGVQVAVQKTNDTVQYPLSVMANSCMNLLKTKKYANATEAAMIARVMVGSIVVYDLVFLPGELGGAFGKKSPIMIKQCAQQLKKLEAEPQRSALQGFIKFTTKNFKDASDSIRADFE